jgi:hypothetical protein
LAHAYTPGLKIIAEAEVIKERRLPLSGEIIVKKGEDVSSQQVVARTFLPGNVVTVNLANKLGIPAEDVPGVMLKKVDDEVEEGEIIAKTKGIFGLFSSRVESPVKGKIETVSDITGQLILREPPNPVEVNAYIDGKIDTIIENEGVKVKTVASFIQGIFGIGGEVYGEIEVIVNNRSEKIKADMIKDEHKGKILVGGSFITLDAFEKAQKKGVVGLVAGGMDDQDLKTILGYDLGVAITGKEDITTTLIVTEGFGEINMAEETFNLLKERNGMYASMNGATQIRAGVIRPEIIIPIPVKETKRKIKEEEESSPSLDVGSVIRAIREPYFGKIGVVTELPPELIKLETEAKVRILKAKFSDGEEVIIPRANVELIESD